MSDHAEARCPHLDHLPALPAPGDLAALRKPLRRQKPPEFDAGFRGRHPVLGEFRVEGEGPTRRVHWQLPDGAPGTALVSELNTSPALEPARLALGWMVANMVRLDCLHTCAQIGDPLETARLASRLGAIEARWRHWALVSAGHMRLPAAGGEPHARSPSPA